MALHNRGLGCLVPLQLLAAAVAFTQPTLPRRAVLTLAPALALRTALHPAGAKLVTDPKGRFLLDLPDGFVQTKRTAVTGTLFVAGDFPRFAVVSVTAWRVDELLAAEQGQKSLPGLPAAPAASVQAPQALADLGSASAVAQILVRARDREAKAATSSELTSAAFEADGSLSFSFLSPLAVADPDALFEQRGVRELKRRSSATARLAPLGPGSDAVPAVVSAWGGCLVDSGVTGGDWKDGLGKALEQAVSTFRWTAASSA